LANLTLGWLFRYETETEGLLSPQGSPHLGVAMLGVAFLVLRVLARLLIPAMVVFVAVRASLRRLRSRAQYGRAN